MLTRQHVSIEQRGELVVARFGGESFSLEFDVALALAAAMTVEARAAKRASGNDSFSWRSFGALTDAGAQESRASRFRRSLPDRLKARDIAVFHAGAIVTVRIHRTNIDLPYDAARTIAQWLRVRGKAARNAAGESAHWSQLATGATSLIRSAS